MKDFYKIILKNIIGTILILASWISIKVIINKICESFSKSTLKFIIFQIFTSIIIQFVLIEPVLIFIITILCYYKVEHKMKESLKKIFLKIIDSKIYSIHKAILFLEDLQKIQKVAPRH